MLYFCQEISLKDSLVTYTPSSTPQPIRSLPRGAQLFTQRDEVFFVAKPRGAKLFTRLVHAPMLFFAAIPLTDRHCPTPSATMPATFQS
jgi:hypothetical protein